MSLMLPFGVPLSPGTAMTVAVLPLVVIVAPRRIGFGARLTTGSLPGEVSVVLPEPVIDAATV